MKIVKILVYAIDSCKVDRTTHFLKSFVLSYAGCACLSYSRQ